MSGQLEKVESDLLAKELVSNDSSATLEKDLNQIWEETGKVSDNITFDHKKAYQKFKSTIETTSQSTVIESASNAETSTIKTARTINLRYVLAIASMLILGFFAVNTMRHSDNITINSGDTVQLITLPEGSKVTMSPNASISYNKEEFSTLRKISLKGSALFEVEKTGTKFLVESNGFDVNVLGTTFYVESSDNEQNVKVLEGKVEVSTKNNKVLITDRQGVNVEGETIKLIEDLDFRDINWTDPEMIYNNEPVSRVISDIEAKFGVKINFRASQNIDNCTFTSGSLKNNNLDQILNLLEATFSTKFTKKSRKRIFIRGIKLQIAKISA